VAESFFATLERELLDRHPWPTRHGLRTAVFHFIEVFYNPPTPPLDPGLHYSRRYEQHR
jgi:hypothetical protein